MPVDKFGRSGNAKTLLCLSADVFINTINNHFLRRNGRNTVLGPIDMAGNDLNNVGNLLLPVGSDTVRELGCADFTEGKGFIFMLGNRQNILYYSPVEPSKPQQPVTLQTSSGFAVMDNGNNVIQLGKEKITVHKKIRNLPEPEYDDEAATKGFVDQRVLQIKHLITIWVKRYGSINALQYEWSFENSAAGGKGHKKLGYTMMANKRVLRMGLSAHVDGRPVDAPARVSITVNERSTGFDDYSVLIPANSYHGTRVFGEPLELPSSTRINF